MARQKVYNGVYLLGDGPCEANINRIDMGAVPMLCYMMRTGIEVDLSHFARMSVELSRDMDNITEKVKDLTGHYVNIDSGDQVADLLFKKLGLKQARVKFTKSNKRESVEDEVLTAIQHDHPVVPLLQEFKEYSKLRGTYVDPMPKLAKRINSGVYRMVPNLGHTRVPSGRLNCKEPNLLAMPTRTERGREVRKGFIARKGWSLVSIDESQIEVRIGAHNSHDPALIACYHNEEDVYSDFATTAFTLLDERYKSDSGKWKYPTVDTLQHRRPAKTCVLAAIYDVTASGLLEQMPIVCKNCKLEATKHTCGNFESQWHENNCQDLLNAFYMKYPFILRDRKINHARARRNGYIFDMWGRILHVAATRSVLEWVVQAALREVGNFPYQSGAQGTIKLVMAQVQDEFEEMGILGDIANPLLQIHDELLFEVREDYAEEVGAHVADRFEHCVRLDVPIKAGVAMADSWGDLEK